MAKAQPVTKPAAPSPKGEKVTASAESAPPALGEKIGGFLPPSGDEVALVTVLAPQYRIRAARAAGIWRAGRFWPAEGVEVSEDDFTEAQWAQLRAEPVLSINRVEQE